MKKLNSTEVLISKALIDSYISHHNFVLLNNVLREQDDLKENIKKNLQHFIKNFTLFI